MEQAVSGHSIVVATEGQVSCELVDEVAILSLQSGVYYGLNEVGGRIWQLIQQPIPVHQVHETLLAEYDVVPERCERDLVALLQDLAAKGLVEIVHPDDDA
ncbi:MAG: PqqD family peptide modification chaperone [Candidatus Tectomicrobia bacterium]|nr:PqqD family peptide modification chaperone [Candidatus Tectomicrobia bacterium]